MYVFENDNSCSRGFGPFSPSYTNDVTISLAQQSFNGFLDSQINNDEEHNEEV